MPRGELLPFHNRPGQNVVVAVWARGRGRVEYPAHRPARKQLLERAAAVGGGEKMTRCLTQTLALPLPVHRPHTVGHIVEVHLKLRNCARSDLEVEP